MGEESEVIVRVVAIGAGATVALDLWSAFLKRFFQTRSTDWGMVGRWFGHLPRGRFVHNNMALASPVPGELLIGWSAHYATGIAFATLLFAICGLDWMRHPTPVPALLVGLLTVVFPFFIMQPGMGLGVAASKTPKPTLARLRSLIGHTVFGIGLYASALVSALLFRQ
jgi:Protein of unknown function (DUF2938)